MNPLFSKDSKTAINLLSIQAINRVVNHRVKDSLFTYSQDLTVYHYTSPAGVFGILHDGAIRATHIAYLNDSREYVLASKMAEQTIRDLAASGGYKDITECIDAMIENLARAEKIDQQPPIFVTSFSEAEDDLSQWRAYGGGEGGFALGFAAQGLLRRTLKRTQPILFLPCIYDRRFQSDLVVVVLREALDLYRRLISKDAPRDRKQYAEAYALAVLYYGLSSIAAVFKDDTFQAEQEWRIIYWEKEKRNVEILARTQMLSAYVKLAFNGADGGTFPLRSAFVGPGRHSDHSKLALTTLLENKGYDIPVTVSDVHYRVMS